MQSGFRSMLGGGVSALALVMFAYDAVAEARVEPAPSWTVQATRTFSIPAGNLDQALGAYARQSGQEILYTSALVAGRRTAGVSGSHEPVAALRIILQGTGLEVATQEGSVVTLRRASAVESTLYPAQSSTDLDDVIVTGTLLRSSGDLASPVVILDEAALERRGFGTVGEALVALPQNYAGTSKPVVQLANSDTGASNQSYSTGINLRGLGPASTLVLVNGRRMAGAGSRAEFADVSGLPSAAIERVDVLLDGASALYGADAVAGVVNIIMRRSFDGQETRFRASAAQGGAEDLMASHLIGTTWSSGSAYLSYEYQTVNGLNALDRPYTTDGDLRPYGGTDHRNIYSAPGNIVAFDAAASAYVTLFGIRPNASGRAQTAADFAPRTSNLSLSSYGTDLLPTFDRHSAYGRISQSFGDRLELSADVRYNRRDHNVAISAPAGIFTVTRANPWFVSPNNAASHTIAYSFGRELGQTRNIGETENFAVTVGGRYDISDDWSVEAYVAHAGEDALFGTYNRPHSRRLAEALGNIPDDPDTPYRAAVDGYFNLFGDGTANSRALLDFIGTGYSQAFNGSRATSANAVAQGPVFRLPGGEVSLAIGAQWRTETFETWGLNAASATIPTRVATPQRERTVQAVFAETRLPLVGPDNARPWIQSLDVSFAARLEDYDDFGSTTNPKVGVVWSPVEGLRLRASWGTSFRAGALPQLFDTPVAATGFFNRTNGTRTLSLQLAGGNPDLRPESSETFAIGFDYHPSGGPTFSFNYFDTQYTDKIARPVIENINGALDDPNLTSFVRFLSPMTNPADLALVESYITAPGYVALYPANTYGAIVDARWVNTGALNVRGLDLSGSYGFDSFGGRLTFDTTASYVLEYQTQATPTAVVRDVEGLIGFPVRLRSRSGVSWSREDIRVSAHWSYVDDYKDRFGTKIDAFNTIDAQFSWSPVKPLSSGLRATLTVQNVFDEDPPFYDSIQGYGFDAGQASLLGRVFALQLIQNW